MCIQSESVGYYLRRVFQHCSSDNVYKLIRFTSSASMHVRTYICTQVRMNKSALKTVRCDYDHTRNLCPDSERVKQFEPLTTAMYHVSEVMCARVGLCFTLGLTQKTSNWTRGVCVCVLLWGLHKRQVIRHVVCVSVFYFGAYTKDK